MRDKAHTEQFEPIQVKASTHAIIKAAAAVLDVPQYKAVEEAVRKMYGNNPAVVAMLKQWGVI